MEYSSEFIRENNDEGFRPPLISPIDAALAEKSNKVQNERKASLDADRRVPYKRF